jgi:ribosomal protein S14
MNEANQSFSAGRCDACGSDRGLLMKLSLGKDFFGRAYDRLSPSADTRPKWYCEYCSMHKNLQRDFRDIRTEFDKLCAGQPSELASSDHLQRAQLRLREITELLQGQAAASRLLDPAEVNALIDRFQARSGAPTATR